MTQLAASTHAGAAGRVVADAWRRRRPGESSGDPRGLAGRTKSAALDECAATSCNPGSSAGGGTSAGASLLLRLAGRQHTEITEKPPDAVDTLPGQCLHIGAAFVDGALQSEIGPEQAL